MFKFNVCHWFRDNFLSFLPVDAGSLFEGLVLELLDGICEPMGQFLIGHAVLDAIAGQDHEFAIPEVHRADLGHGNDELFVICVLLVQLLSEVPECAAQVQVRIHAVVRDLPACALYALLLLGVLGLVVKREGVSGLVLLVCDSAGVAGVGAVELAVLEEADIGGAAAAERDGEFDDHVDVVGLDVCEFFHDVAVGEVLGQVLLLF